MIFALAELARSSSPVTKRRSTNDSAAVMSADAVEIIPDTVRTEWSSGMLRSHSGYHTDSATEATTSGLMPSACSSVTSRSE